MGEEQKIKKYNKVFYRKRVELFSLVQKIKLWPSRRGILHGIKSFEKIGEEAYITTHCNKTFLVNNSRNSRSARWLRNKMFSASCGECKVPKWKMAKYSSTHFRRDCGSLLISTASTAFSGRRDEHR